MTLNVEHLQRTADTLEQALLQLQRTEKNTVMYDLFRNAAIKSFELSLETAGKLLRKAIKAFGASPRSNAPNLRVSMICRPYFCVVWCVIFFEGLIDLVYAGGCFWPSQP